MKKFKLLIVSSCVLMSLMFIISCSSDDSEDWEDDSNSKNSGTVELRGYPNSDNKISFYATIKEGIIDWGDGSVEEYTPNEIQKEFIHEYSNQNYQTITIKTQGMTSFILEKSGLYGVGTYSELRFGNCPNLKEVFCNQGYRSKLTHLEITKAEILEVLDCSRNSLVNLDISKCKNIKRLGCRHNKLTNLNIEGCSQLSKIDCYSNDFSISMVNSIFNNLPKRENEDNATLAITDRESEGSDISIATNKGWEITDGYLHVENEI